MRAGDIFENREECDEATAGVAEVWSELWNAIARSMVGEFVSLDDGVTTMGEFGTLHWQHTEPK